MKTFLILTLSFFIVSCSKTNNSDGLNQAPGDSNNVRFEEQSIILEDPNPLTGSPINLISGGEGDNGIVDFTPITVGGNGTFSTNGNNEFEFSGDGVSNQMDYAQTFNVEANRTYVFSANVLDVGNSSSEGFFVAMYDGPNLTDPTLFNINTNSTGVHYRSFKPTSNQVTIFVKRNSGQNGVTLVEYFRVNQFYQVDNENFSEIGDPSIILEENITLVVGGTQDVFNLPTSNLKLGDKLIVDFDNNGLDNDAERDIFQINSGSVRVSPGHGTTLGSNTDYLGRVVRQRVAGFEEYGSGSGSVTLDNGKLRVEQSGASLKVAIKDGSFEAGKYYRVSVRGESQNGGPGQPTLRITNTGNLDSFLVEDNSTMDIKDLEVVFLAEGNDHYIRLQGSSTGGITTFDNLVIEELDQIQENSNEVIDMGILSKVGQKIIKRVYISNKTSESRDISISNSLATGLTVLNNTCPASLNSNGLCYIDVQHELSSESQLSFNNTIVDFVSNPPIGAQDLWGKLSFVGALSSEIDNGLAKLSDIVVSTSVLSFNAQEGQVLRKRIYLSNNSTNDLNSMDITAGNGFSIATDTCGSTIKAKRICYVDVEYTYETDELLKTANTALSLSSEIGLIAEVTLIGISAANNNANQFAALDGSGSPIDLSQAGPEADYSDLDVNSSRTVRIFFVNQNSDYDFGSPSSVNPIGDIVVERTSCSGVIKTGDICYIDVTYTRQEIPASDTKLEIAPNLDYEFALPGGVFDESYFDSAVFQ